MEVAKRFYLYLDHFEVQLAVVICVIQCLRDLFALERCSEMNEKGSLYQEVSSTRILCYSSCNLFKRPRDIKMSSQYSRLIYNFAIKGGHLSYLDIRSKKDGDRTFYHNTMRASHSP